MGLFRVACALAGCVAAAAVPAWADEPPTGIPDPSIVSSLPQELADPGGVRSALAGRGITFGVNYIGQGLGNTDGGFEQSTYYDGRLEIVVEAEMEKVIGWKGLLFHANGYQIHCESITGQALGAPMPVSFIEARPATRLFELWLEQRLLNNKVSIRFGQLAADSEFIISDSAAAFINGT